MKSLKNQVLARKRRKKLIILKKMELQYSSKSNSKSKRIQKKISIIPFKKFKKRAKIKANSKFLWKKSYIKIKFQKKILYQKKTAHSNLIKNNKNFKKWLNKIKK